jgi:hypothetical protein
LADSVKSPRFLESRRAGGGVTCRIGLPGFFQRSIRILVGDVFGMLDRAWRRLMMELGADSLRRCRAAVRAGSDDVDTPRKSGDLRSARAAMRDARPAEQHSAHSTDEYSKRDKTAASGPFRVPWIKIAHDLSPPSDKI